MKQQEWFRAKIRWAVMVEGWEALRFRNELEKEENEACYGSTELAIVAPRRR